ncbi:innexin shaking-B [Cryptotermes secundus]|uniref:innexin shaking-B n=1 Tax=Cryptotermes secundus TaxID=105785 RepID=UPI000CD7DEF2|nr:innexin shaking-B [Cryptotermes secundus]
MWDLVKGVATAFKARRVNTDSTIFKLHYQATFCTILVFTVILAANQYVGKPIRCLHQLSGQPDEVLDTFCWIHSTYTVTSAFLKKVGVEVPFPGVSGTRGSADDIKVYRFYQWVSFCLVFQAILFYAPRWLWKSWEGGKLQALKMDLDVGIMTEVDRKQKEEMMLTYLQNNRQYHNFWAFKYFFCEFLALVNVIGQIFLMDHFLDGEFFTYGIDVINFMQSDQEDRVDPMIYIFPRMTKCTFYKYGVSGEVERHDSICILPLNIVNEKIYIVLWFWFIILAILTLLLIIYRLCMVTSYRLRAYLFKINYGLIRRSDIEKITRHYSVGDWYLLYMIGVNIDARIFNEVFHELAEKIIDDREEKRHII